MNCFHQTVIRSILTALVLVNSGCANPGLKYQTGEEVAADSTIEVDPYRNTVTTKTPSIADYPLIFTFRHILLNKSGAESYHLYIHYGSPTWKFFERAYDSDGEALKFTSIDRSISNTGTVSEDFIINFDRQYLERKAKSDGLNIKFVGQKGSFVYTWRPIWLQGFLQKVDSQGSH